ncbi:MAG: hypothetical protein CME62_05350 [Halobacteriovoraceae bacterium]|nr:hypothetical protein [Halobacteriovoraceae bacterium]|tara:strand:- start:29838 stop:30098 length:261 start_codon:yes stop_codon:yes gene_type:complete
MDKLEEELLKTLSFMEPMSEEFIYLDLDQQFLLENPELTIEDLKSALTALEKQLKIKRMSSENQEKWIKVFPRKSLFQRLKRFIGL